MKLLALLATAATTAACYGAAPPRPVAVSLPPAQVGAEIEVHSETKTTYESVEKRAVSCPQGKSEGDPSCTVTRYNVTEPVTRTTSAASYAGDPITYAQFKVMTDPQYHHKVEAIADLSRKCQRANIPRYAGLALFAAGLIGGPILSSQGNATGGSLLTYGGMLGGGASYALGYFAFGGRDCNEARAIYRNIDYRAAMSWNTVEGADVATEMSALAQQFNAMQARTRTTTRN
jgi:hypothetical protein